ncbi:transporter [Paenalcaligenes hermetiae]|uniref:Transporter n=1 Tax=Paenalcaligenes hermetiae TaxID=1157987 RepID=A0ABP9LXL7_9BURK
MSWKGWTCVGLLLASSASWADPSARDWIPAPAGTNIIAGYLGYQKANRMYEDGRRVQGAPKLDVQYGIYRQMHYRELAGKTVQYEVIVPVSRATLKGNGFPKDRLSGVGDVNIGAAVWLHNNDETRTYVAWEPFLVLPTGRYRGSQADVSPGENRWSLIQDFAFVKGIGKSSYIEGMAEFEVFGKNTNYYGQTLKKNPAMRLMAFASTDLSPSTYVGLRYRYETGGKEKIHGQKVAGSANDHQIAAELTHQLNDQHQLQLQYAHDIKVRNGPKFNGVQLRYAFLF